MKTKELKREEAIERSKKGSKEDKPTNPCTTCKYHSNNPSWCSRKELYVPRKSTCESYKECR